MLSLYGIERYIIATEGQSLFNNIVLNDKIDKGALVDRILLESANFDCCYQDGDFLKFAIENFFSVHKPDYDRLVKLSLVEYDPLNNYDRTETIDTTDHAEGKLNAVGVVENRGDYQDEFSNSSKNSVSTYPSDSFHDDTLTENEGANENNHYDKTESNTGNESSSDSTHKHTAHLVGNIGVTTSQQMYVAEWDLAHKNIIKYITDDFLNEFCVLIY